MKQVLKSGNKINSNYSAISRKMVTKYFQIIPKAAFFLKEKVGTSLVVQRLRIHLLGLPW